MGGGSRGAFGAAAVVGRYGSGSSLRETALQSAAKSYRNGARVPLVLLLPSLTPPQLMRDVRVRECVREGEAGRKRESERERGLAVLPSVTLPPELQQSQMCCSLCSRLTLLLTHCTFPLSLSLTLPFCLPRTGHARPPFIPSRVIVIIITVVVVLRPCIAGLGTRVVPQPSWSACVPCATAGGHGG